MTIVARRGRSKLVSIDYTELVAQAAAQPNGVIIRAARRLFPGRLSVGGQLGAVDTRSTNPYNNQRELSSRVVAHLLEPKAQQSFLRMLDVVHRQQPREDGRFQVSGLIQPSYDPDGWQQPTSVPWPLIKTKLFFGSLKTIIRHEWVNIIARWDMAPTENAAEYQDDPWAVRSGGFVRVVEHDSEEPIGTTLAEQMKDDVDVMSSGRRGRNADGDTTDNAFGEEYALDRGYGYDERLERDDAVEQGYTDRNEEHDPLPVYYPSLRYERIKQENTNYRRDDEYFINYRPFAEREIMPVPLTKEERQALSPADLRMRQEEWREWKKILGALSPEHRWSNDADDGSGRWVRMNPLSEDPSEDPNLSLDQDRVNRMPPRLRQLTDLAMKGYTDDQIAAFMGTTNNAVVKLRGRVGEAYARAVKAPRAIRDNDDDYRAPMMAQSGYDLGRSKHRVRYEPPAGKDDVIRAAV